jgi:GT2 family glycosyltransferase
MIGHPPRRAMVLPAVVVVVVCWNCRDDIERCLRCLETNTRYARWQLVVIDNASADGTGEWLAARPPGTFEFVRAERNLGWVGALNFALLRYNADYYFFLNPDAFVEPDWLAPLVAALEANPRAGFASPQFRYLDGSIHFNGAYISPTGGFRVDGHAPAHRGWREIPFAHGQCLFRAATTHDVGLLDEGFGIGYFEEVDYQLRARRKGWTALIVPSSVIVHVSARAFDKRPSGFKEELLIRNWLRVMTLHWPLSLLLRRFPLEMLRSLGALRGGPAMKPTLRAWRGWLEMLPEIVARRSVILREGEPVDFSTLHRPL